MKRRLGLVSNSSSSSYLIKVTDKPIGICKHCGQGSKLTFTQLFRASDADETYMGMYSGDSHTEEELINKLKEIIDELTDDNDAVNYKERLEDTVQKIQEAQSRKNKDDKILMIHIDYEDQFIQEVFKSYQHTGMLEIIAEETGF